MKIIIFSFTVLVLFLSGCGGSSYGMFTAQHNGKLYWNPGNCDRYRYQVGLDVIHCTDKDSIMNGQSLYPASEEQIANYRYNQQQSRQSANQALNSISQGLQDSARQQREQNQMMINMMPQNHNVYIMADKTNE